MRTIGNWSVFEQLAQDVRYATRAMRANPVFTATAALSLALGIGANTAIYSFMDAIMMRALPVRQPEELVIFHWRSATRAGVVHSINGSAQRYGQSGTNSPNFPFASFDVFARDRSSLSVLFSYAYGRHLNLVANHQAVSANGVPVSGNFF